jgi:tRNA 2-thiouridine synthesizing protein A
MTMSGVEAVTQSGEPGKPDPAPVADKTLDLRGVSCPLPPLKTLGALRRMRSGEILEVLGTSPIGNNSAPFLAQVLGNQLLRVIPDDGFKRFFYRKR